MIKDSEGFIIKHVLVIHISYFEVCVCMCVCVCGGHKTRKMITSGEEEISREMENR